MRRSPRRPATPFPVGILVATALLVFSATVPAQTGNYHWTISASDTDPFVQSGSFPTGSPTSAYLWLVSCDVPPPLPEGMQAAEMGIIATPNVLHLATTPRPGFLNAGGVSDLFLAVGGCPCGPIVAADLLIIATDNVPGAMCIGPNSSTGIAGTVDCGSTPQEWPMTWDNLGINGAPPTNGCMPDVSGGCCLPDGSCVIADSPSACSAMGGVFRGAGTDCSTPCPTGACCLDDGSCVEVAGASQCALLGGDYQGDGSNCATSDCTVTGACCLPDGSCAQVDGLPACQALGGSFQGSGVPCSACQGGGGPGVGWTISGSDADPYETVVTLSPGVSTVYLWLACAGYPVNGISAAEFGIATSPELIHLATTPRNGFLNAGGISNVLLAVGGCPLGPIVAADLTVFSPAGGPATMCFVPSIDGYSVVVDCQIPNPGLWPFDWQGLAANGAVTCFAGDLCSGPVSVQPLTWGRLKSLYH